MSLLAWILVAAAVLVVAVAAFAVIRTRQRRGAVLASRPLERQGTSR